MNGKNGSFLIQLRTELYWNHNSFVNLTIKLFQEYKITKDDKELDREISSGVWYISNFIKDWTQHKNFPKKFPSDYYKKAYELLDDLSWAYFMNDSAYNSESDIKNEITALEVILQQDL